jgi:hypothetical protein
VERREGVSTPAPASPEYRAELGRIASQHGPGANVEHFIDAVAGLGGAL